MGQHVTDVGLEKSSKQRELKKHAATIHCSNTLSLLQRKVSNALLFHAYKELMQKEEHEITIKQLCKLIGYHGHNHAVIREALKELISTVIEWNLINDVTGAENWTASSIIASVSLEGPMCYYAYSPRMKQLLHSPSMFGKIDLVIQSKFRSSYGLALYENCIRYRGLPHTKWFEMDLFKKLMGVPAGIYDVFRDFKRRVLDKAVDEVNMYSDLTIEPEMVKEGRKVVRIRFKLHERAKKTRLGLCKSSTELLVMNPEKELAIRLKEDFGLTEEQINKLLDQYPKEFIQAKIAIVVASKPYQESRVQNLAGYLISAIKNDYQPPKAKHFEVVNLQAAKAEMEFNDVKRLVEEVKERYQEYREEMINTVIDSLPPDDRARFMEDFAFFAEPAIQTVLHLQGVKYSRETVMASPQIQGLLRQFASRELDLSSLVSLEEYVANLEDKYREAWQKLKSYDPEHPLLSQYSMR